MIQIECSKCADWIRLPFHKGEEVIKCPHCAGTIPVREIFVSGGPFIMLREILVSNMQRYRRLVSEVEKEILELQKNCASSRAHDVSARSLSLFVADLKEMLDGCRDCVRHNVNGVKEIYTIGSRRYYARVLNLSVAGACLEAGRTASVNRLWSNTQVILRGEKTGPFTIEGKIMWIDKGGRMGIKFSNVDEQLTRLIQGYILEKTDKRAKAAHARKKED